MKKYKLLLLLCLVLPFLISLPVESFQVASGTFTHCYKEDKVNSTGTGGFYLCNDIGCAWKDKGNPDLETIEECDQSPILN